MKAIDAGENEGENFTEVFITMFYALVHYPNIDTERINQFRGKYDPHVDLIEPHITFMFLTPESIGERRLVHHIETVLSRWEPFPIRLKGFRKAWDHWLFLTLLEGNEEAIRLFSEVYTGILEQYRRDDIEFIPHVGLGLFAKRDAEYDIRDPREAPLDADEYARALKEAEQLNLDYRCVVDRLHLVKITDDISQIVWSKEFSLRT